MDGPRRAIVLLLLECVVEPLAPPLLFR